MSGAEVTRLFGRVGVAAVAVALLAGVATPGVATAATRPELREAMQGFVDAGFTGMQLRVHDERGEWAGSAGVSRLGGTAKPPTNGRFRVGSVTKTITATVVLQLVAEGRVELDAPAADHLPQFDLDPRITVRMLLQHTSGVFNHTGDFDADNNYVPGPVLWRGNEWVDDRFHSYQPADLARFSLAKPLKFEPGTAWHYTNTNYTLARLLIENVTGHSYVEETKRRLLRPLGMRGTVMPGTSPEIPGPHAHAYYRYDGAQQKIVDVTRQNPSWVDAGGDMISTTRDLSRFFTALQDGTLLPAPLLAQMRTPDPTAGYGLGVFVQDGTAQFNPFPPPSCGTTVLTHNGSMQGYATLMYSTPDGSKTLTASLNYVDDVEGSMQTPFRTELQKLVDVVFCDR